MVFDLGIAMRKKGEFESARLMDFEFRRRARATRTLASALDLDGDALVAQVARIDEDRLIDLISRETGIAREEVVASYRRCLGDAHRSLVAEFGDPTPHRLA